ncbi:hypothetical protein VPH35_110202 [Triticum aestivum]
MKTLMSTLVMFWSMPIQSRIMAFPKMLSSVCCSHSLSEMLLRTGTILCHQDHTLGVIFHKLSCIDIFHFTSKLQFVTRSSVLRKMVVRACMQLGRDISICL